MERTDQPSVQSSPKVGRTLCDVSSDCIGLIACYLSWSNVTALKISGNPLLNAKIDQGMAEIRFELWPLSKWPSHVFKYRNLRSICALSAGIDELYHPIIAPNDNLLPQEPHYALQRLQVSSTLSFTVLSDSTLATLLPNLKVLKLAGNGKFIPKMLRHVPQTVINLKLKITSTDLNEANNQIFLSDIEVLPRDLHSLSLRGRTLTFDKTTNSEMVQKALPQHLNRLRLTVTDLSQMLSGIPISITHLTLEARGDSMANASFSHVLPRIEYLRLVAPPFGYIELRHPGPFPTSLTVLRTSFKTSFLSQGSIHGEITFPPSLTRIEGYEALSTTSMDYEVYLPNLTALRIEEFPNKGELDKVILPSKQLRHLVLNDVDRVSFDGTFLAKLPDTLTHLYASIKNVPIWLETILRLKNLRKLELHPNTDALPIDTFWRRISPRLESLRARTSHFDSLEGFGGDWSQLKELYFIVHRNYSLPPNTKVDLNDGLSIIHTNNTSFAWTYPASLEHLNLHIGSHWNIFLHHLTYATKLTKLAVDLSEGVISETEAIGANRALRHLPASLRYLTTAYYAPFGPEQFQELPQGLRSLTATINWPSNMAPQSRRRISLDDLSRLPASVTSFNSIPSSFVDQHLARGARLPAALTHTSLPNLVRHLGQGSREAQRQSQILRCLASE